MREVFFNVHREREWVGGAERACRVYASVPVADLNKSQEKGKGLPLLLSICKKQLPRSPSWSLFRRPGKEDRDGARGRKDRRRDKREEEEKVHKPGTCLHLYGLRPEHGLVRGGRGATSACGQKLISKEKESGEE